MSNNTTPDHSPGYYIEDAAGHYLTDDETLLAGWSGGCFSTNIDSAKRYSSSEAAQAVAAKCGGTVEEF